MNYSPREKELSFLGTDNGRRLCYLQSCVDASIHESQDITAIGTIVQSSNANILSDILKSRDTQFITKSSPFHANIERFPSYVG